uniref:Uncharacterized protein n=1 Tax=Brassica campestris TaxID=3711 RepID=M4DFA4_BRACM
MTHKSNKGRNGGSKGRTADAEGYLYSQSQFVAGCDAPVQQRSNLDPFLDMTHNSNGKEIIVPGQNDATMAEPDVSSTKDKPGWINGENTDLIPAGETEDELEPAEESMHELKPAEVRVDELDELSEISDTEDGTGLAAGRNGLFQPKEKFITNSIWVGFTPNLNRPYRSPFQAHSHQEYQEGVSKEVLVVHGKKEFNKNH